MRYIQPLILSLSLGFLTLEFVPWYGEVLAGLYAPLTEALTRA
ncbi:hypothetical protein [Parasulfuritortus cantonensis]|nr:hypothetical protein [Parasulfuritortus cantonensis]